MATVGMVVKAKITSVAKGGEQYDRPFSSQLVQPESAGAHATYGEQIHDYQEDGKESMMNLVPQQYDECNHSPRGNK